MTTTLLPIRRLERSDWSEWLRMSRALFEGASIEEDDEEMQEFFGRSDAAVFGIDRGDGALGGFIEVGARSISDGCRTSPVGYIEAWYVDADLRRKGYGRRLIDAAENWSRSQGYTEIGSDALLDNEISHAAHRQLGYQEVDKVIVYRKDL